MIEFEKRSYCFEIRAEKEEGQKGVISGRPIVYESKIDMGDFYEVIAKGALDKADLKDVRFLVNHDISRIPLARSRNNNENSTMRLLPDENGLAIKVLLDVDNNSEARSLYSAIERGDITGMSFMFAIDKESWDDVKSAHPTRTIEKISKVVEVSAVTFPAYEDTEISTRNKKVLESARSTLESVRSLLDSEIEVIKLKNKILGGK